MNGKSLSRRREFLGAVVLAGTAGLSGCLGSPFADDTDDADDADEELHPDAPDELIPEGPTVRLEPVAEGLTYPTDLTGHPDDPGELYVTDITGQVYRIVDGERGLLLDIGDSVGVPEGEFSERGLLGIALHPDFAENGRFYLRYSGTESPTGASHVEHLSEFVLEDGEVDAEDERSILELDHPTIIHQSGNVLFGPEGYLYVPMGDGGGPFDSRPQDWYETNDGGRAQNTTDDLLGGVLRIDVDGNRDDDQPYAIPAGNPLVDREAHLDEYYAWGFRNPWGSSFDGEDLYVADVAEGRVNSVNLVERGGNYSWNVKEGTSCFNTDDVREPRQDCPDETPEDVRGGEQLRDPVIEYPQEYEDTRYGSAVVGGYVYRGDDIPDIEGAYVFGDWSRQPHGDPDGVLYVANEDDPRHEYNAERDTWQLHQLVVDGDEDDETPIGEDGELNRYIASLGRSGDDIYVLTTATNVVEGETGTVHRLSRT